MLARELLAGVRVAADPTWIDALAASLGERAHRASVRARRSAGSWGAAVDVEDGPRSSKTRWATSRSPWEREVLERHVEWRLPTVGGLGQGKVAGVPAKVAWLPDGRAWVVVQAAYAHELEERLGWR